MGDNIPPAMRKVFPKNHQIVIGLYTAYIGVFGLYKMKKNWNPKPVAVVAPTTAAAVSSPSASGRPWESFDINDDAKTEKWFANSKNIEAWEQYINVPGNLDKLVAENS